MFSMRVLLLLLFISTISSCSQLKREIASTGVNEINCTNELQLILKANHKDISKLFNKYHIGESVPTQKEARYFYIELFKIIYGHSLKNSDSDKIILQKIQIELLSDGLIETSKKLKLPVPGQWRNFKSFIHSFSHSPIIKYSLTGFSNVMIAYYGGIPSLIRGIDFTISPKDIEKFLQQGDKALPEIFKKYRTQASLFTITHKLRYLSSLSIVSLMYAQYEDQQESLEKKNLETEILFQKQIDTMGESYEVMAKVVLSPLEQDFINSFKEENGRLPNEYELNEFKAIFE